MAFGLSGRTELTSMIGADATVAWVDSSTGMPNAVDYFLTQRVQVGIMVECATNLLFKHHFANQTSLIAGGHVPLSTEILQVHHHQVQWIDIIHYQHVFLFLCSFSAVVARELALIAWWLEMEADVPMMFAVTVLWEEFGRVTNSVLYSHDRLIQWVSRPRGKVRTLVTCCPTHWSQHHQELNLPNPLLIISRKIVHTAWHRALSNVLFMVLNEHYIYGLTIIQECMLLDKPQCKQYNSMYIHTQFGLGESHQLSHNKWTRTYQQEVHPQFGTRTSSPSTRKQYMVLLSDWNSTGAAKWFSCGSVPSYVVKLGEP